MNVVWHSREEVGLDPPWRPLTGWETSQPSAIAIHHTGAQNQPPPTSLVQAFEMWRATQRFHRAQYELYQRTNGAQGDNYSDVAYNEAGCQIGDTYHVLEGRGTEHRSGATSRTHNPTHFAHVLLGNYQQYAAPPGLAEGLGARCRQLNGWYDRRIGSINGHGALTGGATSCPGQSVVNLLPKVREIAFAMEPQDPDPSVPPPQEDPTVILYIERQNYPISQALIGGWAVCTDGRRPKIRAVVDGLWVPEDTTPVKWSHRGDVLATYPGVDPMAGFSITIPMEPGLRRFRVLALVEGLRADQWEAPLTYVPGEIPEGCDHTEALDELGIIAGATARARRLLGE